MICLVYLIGVAFGTIFTLIISNRKTVYGYFNLEPTEEEELYIVRISLPSDKDLPNKKRIILKKAKSQK